MITRIYDYITQNITYDYDKASDPPTGYTSDVDAILASGTGICLDYAAVMASMLRSQRIPTRLEVGYAQDSAAPGSPPMPGSVSTPPIPDG